MKSWKEVLVEPETPLRQTILKIDLSSLQIALVVDPDRKLRGVVTDGDVRRAILRRVSLDAPTSEIMNPEPRTLRSNASPDEIQQLQHNKRLHQVPILDDDGRVVDLRLINELPRPDEHQNWVVLMAGGLGSRLHTMTKHTPKPLLPVGEKPILETIIQRFIDQGFRKFFISVNYKAEMIQAHFGDGSQWNVQIEYLKENQRLGTAGALSLLGKRPDRPLLVMNGDLLTEVNFARLLDFHTVQKAGATMCVREYDFQVPFGVVEVEGSRVASIQEKPVHRFFVNAGIYVLEPQVLDLIPGDSFFDMPSLFQQVMNKGGAVEAFPIHEYWLDIGCRDDFDRATEDFHKQSR